MSGNTQGGLLAKEKMLKSDPDYYRNLGRKGGKAPHSRPRGFAAMSPEKRSEAGTRGGQISRRKSTK